MSYESVRPVYDPRPGGLRLALLCAALLAAVPAQAQAIRYVDADATGAGDGTSWADAFPHLQAALSEAEAGDQVWVAEGTYRPTDGGPDPADRTATFVLASGVRLYGGFEGTEATLEDRDWTVYETILSGDIGVVGDSLDNSYHVVTASGTNSTTALDGFTIEYGRADEQTPPHSRGGGVFAEGGSLRLRNLVFRRNGGREGGGLHFEGSAPLLEACLFEDNLGIGGGAYFSGGEPVLREVTFRSNFAQGLILADNSSAVIEDGLIETNARGGGLAVIDSSPIIRRTTFRNNSMYGSDGGAVYTRGLSEPLFEDCLFEDNWAEAGGGATFSKVGGTPTFIRSTFRNNVAEHGPGGGAAEGGTPLGRPAYYINCRFEGNEAPRAGGLDSYSAFTTVLNSVFVGNRATGTHAGSGGTQPRQQLGQPEFTVCRTAGQLQDHGALRTMPEPARAPAQSMPWFTNRAVKM